MTPLASYRTVLYDLGMTTVTCTYQIGQRVEVLVHNFDVPGFPEQWLGGKVIEVELLNVERRVWDVKVWTDKETYSMQAVGPRGGNKRIRAEAA